MTAPRRNHGRAQAAWNRSCLEKVRFADEHAARARASQILAAGRSEETRLWVYRCENCRGWHMTKRPQGLGVTATDLYAPPEPIWRREGFAR